MSSRSQFKGSTLARFVKNPGTNSQPYQRRPEEEPLSNFNNENAHTKLSLVQEVDQIDSVFGFDRYESGPKKVGWLINMHTTSIPSEDLLQGYSGVDYYFLDEEGGGFKVTKQYDPYFFIICKQSYESEVEEYLRKQLEGLLKKASRVEKEDLSLPNHLIGLKRTLIQLSFHNISNLLEARRIIAPIVKQNKLSKEQRDVYNSDLNYNLLNEEEDLDLNTESRSKPLDIGQCLEDIREYDVPYHVRVSIDNNYRIGKWYTLEADAAEVTFTEMKDKLAFADPIVLAFDIETTKAPLKFPDSSIDQVMMISYMIDGEGFLITNREIINAEIEDFEYTPKPEYPGLFTIFNEPDEKALIERFFEHIREVRPTVIATFNGDFFDWPFVEKRAFFHGIDMFKEIGFAKDMENEYKSKYCVHMDCYRWVKRDSYLPQGSQGLKAVTTVKLGYNPTELDPELMTPYAYEKPQLLAEYSVSDAVATYYLYYKYVHPFVFSLCTIIPLNPDEVLRKGTGTLCEMLLMVQAYENNILLPNKHTDPLERFYEGHLIESETYVGGHVESLEAGVFRSDIPTDFQIDPTAVDEILSTLDQSLKFSIEVESKKQLKDITNYDEIYAKIKGELLELKNNPKRHEAPLIYHVDVASMYPNIMTTNRLQPDSMKTDQDCAECDFNRPGKTCDRRLLWAWRGEFYPADYSEYKMIEHALSNDTFAPEKPWLPRKTFDQLSHVQRAALIKSNLSDYSRKVYHRIKQTKTIEKEAIVCQRENPFYVNTVRSFRDRRYEFKGLAKVWKGKASKIPKEDVHSLDEAKKMVVLYDSLQLAHKVILNSFYGYVMRKGSRWYSVEMAGITCLTGATIIQLARSLVERLGRPLELDTDGIWCILPSSFPEDFDFKMKNGKTLTVSYSCSMLNYLVHEKFTNHQYQELVDPVTHQYKTYSDNSIFFELDGPYKAMILPTSKEEGKGLKKRYAVFNFDGSLAELKGFELKRRGELQLIKNFQSDIFKLFLHGDTLEGCYQTVANVANRWLDVLDSKGANVEDEDLIELICENRSMSKTLAEYGTQKSTSITTARRLGEFLGEEMVKDKGLACKYVIANRPLNAPITERAIPVIIFSSDTEIKKRYLRRWLGDSSLENFDPRTIIDWEYYTERLASVVQKIITIPAALQNVSNPVPRVAHPDWLQKKVNSQNDSKKQSSLTQFFGKTTNTEIMKDISNRFKDIEDFGTPDTNGMSRKMGKVTSRKRKQKELEAKIVEEEQKLLEGECPNELEDYGSFLNYQKAKWKLQSQNRERRRKLFGTSVNTAARGTIGNIMRKKAESYVGSSWQVLQYKHDSTCKPGEVKALVFIDGRVQTFSIAIPKKVFLGLKTADMGSMTIPDECTIEPSTNHLPKGEKVESLFKLTMSEETFDSEQGNCNGLFQHEDVKCMYESQIDCTERVIVELGNSIKFQENQLGALGKALQNGFNQKNFTSLPSERYLSHFNMNVTYLIHIVANGYEVFSLFKSWDPSVSVFVLKPNMAASSLPRNMESVYQDYYQSKKERLSHNIIQYEEHLSFDLVDFTDKDKLLRNLNTKCGKANEEKNSKSLMVIQSNQCTKLIRALKNVSDQPVISMNLREITLSPLSWKSSVINKIINHYLSLGAGLKDLISMARYGNIPLCNLNVEDKSYLIDIQYARKLIELGIVLWWSPNPLPDHGGFEVDQSMTNIEKSLEFPTINKPEIYETVCLELSLSNLTINTILTSALINEAEGLEIGDNDNTTSFAEDIFSTPALQALRLLLKSWWDDALKNNIDADIMVFNFMSWVEKTSSYLYDPSLLYHVYNLTKKSLLHLLGEFKRLGSTIVFANRNKIILKTSKVLVENSYAYGQYIIKTVRSKSMFNYLEFQVVRYWDLLIWMDQYNYGGNGCAQITSNEVQDLELINHWQLQQFLPSVLQQEFEDWVVVILDSFLKCKQLDLKGSQTAGTPRQTQIQHILKKQNQQQSLSTDFVYEKPENNVIDMFGNVLEKRVITLKERQLRTMLNPALKAEYEFPKLPGSQFNLSDATLEFVKFLCHILSLSKSRNIEVRVLRRNILKLFDVKEFSAEATFRNPAASLRLYNVHCEICNHITDLDLCRDSESEIFNCQNCKRQFNKLALEERLIADAQKLLVHFYNQDLKCSKCHRLRSSELQLYCSCSGSWVGTVNRSDILKRMRTFHTVAEFYDFNLLKEVAATGE